ncbi:hypothetical protein Misp01_25420 [Microtetraspora sp. NBRC 13810]|uniref:DUF6542 domain-containing protein n=1 Tax=Microtetraspora sp. NBRC 13810 TaxID=3030990 RepID=UPI0024A03BEF|nr:DUF6542 domain-containing protein [Microtetraspora sp. NBRC 13810]GLW07412.1 hypothetical protein Misp01_25420 [Microtetraspora sp. NBRC 13810]
MSTRRERGDRATPEPPAVRDGQRGTGGRGRKPDQGIRVKVTARGAIAVVLASSLVGHLLSGLVGASYVAGLTFVAGCLLAVCLVNPRDLLSLVVTPPLVFFVATLAVEAVRAVGAESMLQALGLGLFTAMSGGAPWLFAGTALVLGVALRRGLRSNVRALREDLRSARGGPDVPRPRVSDEEAFAPEPEGYFEPRVYGKHRDPAE